MTKEVCSLGEEFWRLVNKIWKGEGIPED